MNPEAFRCSLLPSSGTRQCSRIFILWRLPGSLRIYPSNPKSSSLGIGSLALHWPLHMKTQPITKVKHLGHSPESSAIRDGNGLSCHELLAIMKMRTVSLAQHRKVFYVLGDDWS